MLHGSNLTGGTAILTSLRIDVPPQPTTAAVNETQLNVTLPSDLPAGFYTIAVKLTTTNGDISSNGSPLAVAPVITTTLPMTVARSGGNANIALACSVNALPEQRVSLLLGDHETLAEPRTAPTNSFQFIIKQPSVGEFPVSIGVGLLTRLRIDGVDSEIIAPGQPGDPLSFDQNKKITIT